MTPRTFGQLPNGQSVHAWTLANTRGASLQLITYGGIVTHLRVPDRAGKIDDVVLGFDSLDGYLAGHPYFGCTAGRVAGRISEGKFTLEGREYALAVNDPPNHLHGGVVGFDKRVWSAAPVVRGDGAPSVQLTLESGDGEEGYPGTVRAAVTYTLTERNEFIFETEVTSDRPTPASLTHHSYFNLAGESAGPVTAHAIQLRASSYAPTDAAMTLLGRRATVAGAGADFRDFRKLGDALPGILGRHGDLYFVDRDPGAPGALVPAAHVIEPTRGRVLEVRTTEDCIQFYSGVGLDGSLRGKTGSPYRTHAGFCLECEGYPDGVNVPALGDLLVRPGQPRRHTTVYAFSTC